MSACVEMMCGSIVAVVSNSREHEDETNSTGQRTDSAGQSTEILLFSCVTDAHVSSLNSIILNLVLIQVTLHF